MADKLTLIERELREMQGALSNTPPGDGSIVRLANQDRLRLDLVRQAADLIFQAQRVGYAREGEYAELTIDGSEILGITDHRTDPILEDLDRAIAMGLVKDSDPRLVARFALARLASELADYANDPFSRMRLFLAGKDLNG